MNENLDLVEILKYCPKGMWLYSTILGEVELFEISNDEDGCPITVRTNCDDKYSFSVDGRFINRYSGECALFPSKDQRDWNKFKAPIKKFDYNTLIPFDRVLVRNDNVSIWKCALFTCMKQKTMLCGLGWAQGVPYNDDTKHLAGTTDMPDEKYIWWEE